MSLCCGNAHNVPHRLLSQPRGIEIGDWRITVAKGPILDSLELDNEASPLVFAKADCRLKEKLGLPAIPDMTFGHNEVVLLHRPSNFSMSFSVAAALQQWDWKAPAQVMVAAAAKWSAGAEADIKEHKVSMKQFDWTYSTSYSGTISASGTAGAVSETKEAIPLDKLKREDPILFFDELLLFQDELGDNGDVSLSVKLRVMPGAFYLLLQYFLRVDGVMYRSIDTRVYHEFGWNHLLRERSRREAPWQAVLKALPPDPAAATKLQLVYPNLTVVSSQSDHIALA